MFPFEIAQPESPQNDIHDGQAKDGKHPQHDFQGQTDTFALACGARDNPINSILTIRNRLIRSVQFIFGFHF